MIVCNCNFIRERDLREAVRNGASRAHEAYAMCGGKVQCGQCLPFARELIADEKAKLEADAPCPCANRQEADILPFPEMRLKRA